MKSPFPGMDPFLEGQEWQDFHNRLNVAIAEAISPALEPDYFVRTERRVYLEHVGPDPDTFRVADVAVIARDSDLPTGMRVDGSPVSVPAVCTLPQPEERRETYLVIRDRESLEVVTVIETLSPSNKRRGGNGRTEYLNRRDDVLGSRSHLVELDLLRGGERLPVVEPLPAADYFCIVSRTYSRPRTELDAWTLKQQLPTVLIPLKLGDDDVPLALQQVMDSVYSRARYDFSIDYQKGLEPAPTADDDAWIRQRIAEHSA
ncbi:MAG: DUF4058 family protein [Planctomycetaceae bacterium]